ncbi:MAG: chromosomal replication initiator protein DnaA [Ruminococcaceae bacterium]|nr:chromosomal replication initiator protein DnaA [Oscillospiraceae bacterium]
MNNVIDFWERVLDLIEDECKEISPLGFNTWVKTIKPYDFINDTLILTVPMDVNKDIIEKRYLLLIKSGAEILNPQIKRVEVVLEDDVEELYGGKEEKESIHIDESFYKNSNLQKKFTFDNYVIGENNRFACAAALSVAKTPGASYNPFFIYGDVGLGKTHLMQAVGNAILENDSSKKVLYITSEEFVIELVNSIKDNKIDEFRAKYRTLDVLMIDDIQFIGGKDRCQEEFFYTFSHLTKSNKQVIITSDRPPRNISKLDGRLTSRFEGGLTWDIKKPDYETRYAILKKKVQAENLDVSDECIEIIAKRFKDNVREIEGILNKLIAYSTLSNIDITKELVVSLLHDMDDSKPSKSINMDTVIYEVCKYYDIDPNSIHTASRKAEILTIRQICMYVIKEVLDIPLDKIGERFGGKTHSTVINAIDKIKAKIEADEKFRDNIDEIMTNIENLI